MRGVMTVFAQLEVLPMRDTGMSADIADAVAALDDHPVDYETNAMGTVVRADTVGDLLDAVEEAHAAVDGDRVVTSLTIDDHRGRDRSIGDRVASVADALGRDPRS